MNSGILRHHRHLVTRRNLILGSGASLAAGAVGAGFSPGIALANERRSDGMPSSYPQPIPDGIPIPEPLGTGETYHLLPPEPGNNPSTIADFKGSVGLSVLRGEGTGVHTVSGKKERLVYEVDIRFMDGVYIGDDGSQRHATITFL